MLVGAGDLAKKIRMMLTTLVCALGLGKEWSADADDAGSRAVDLGKTGPTSQ